MFCKQLQTGNLMVGTLLCMALIFCRISTEPYEAAIIFMCGSYIQGSLILIPLQRFCCNISTVLYIFNCLKMVAMDVLQTVTNGKLDGWNSSVYGSNLLQNFDRAL